jgi:chemotaxis protein MotB
VSRKKKHEEHENMERWLVSYADFITLLFAFFTVLYATAETSSEKLRAVVDSMNAAFLGGMPHAVLDDVRLDSPSVALAPTTLRNEPTAQEIISSMKQRLTGSLTDNTVQIGLVEQGLKIVMPERVMFKAGSAELNPAAFPLLIAVADAVAPTAGRLEIYGHADGVPVGADSPFRDNWGLSSARAVATVRYLERYGMNPERLTASAGVFRNSNPEARAVTIFVSIDERAVAAEVVEKLPVEQ